jgi:hypothetical protein
MWFGPWLKGTLLGGVILFAWSAVSWMALPLHERSLLGLSNEPEVETAILAGAAESGMYLIPHAALEEGAGEPSAEDQAAAQERMMQGPVVLASVRREPSEGMAVLMGRQLVIFLIGAGLATALVLATRPMRYSRRVLFVAAIGLTIAVVGHLPQANWWGFSAAYTLAEMVDAIIGFTLAGLAIAWVAAPRRGA